MPVNADASGLARSELLRLAAENYRRWAQTATTDEPPEAFNRQSARPDAFFAAALREKEAKRGNASGHGGETPARASATPEAD